MRKKKRRNQKGRGSLVMIRENVWRGRVNIKTLEGKRKQVTKVFYAGQEPPWAEFDSWKAEVIKNYPLQSKNMTIEDLVKYWESNYCAIQLKIDEMRENTKDIYYYTSKRILKYLGSKKVDELSFQDLQIFVNKLIDEGISKKYIKEHVRLIKSILKYADSTDKLNTSKLLKYFENLSYPSKKLNINEVKNSKAAEPSEIKKIEKEAKKKIPLLWVIIQIIKYTGMRRSEVLGLSWQDIMEDRIRVTKQLKKKNGVFYFDIPKTKHGYRVVPIVKQLKQVLTEYKVEQSYKKSIVGNAWVHPEHVITNEIGEYVDPHLVTTWFRKIRKIAGIGRKITLHSIRHFYSSYLSNLGVPVETISLLLGHADRNSTEIYIHHLDANIKQSVHLFEEAIEAFELAEGADG